MPHQYDWINKGWRKTDQPVGFGRYTVRSSGRLHRLLPELIKEIETGDGPAKLYAGLLARHLVVTDIDTRLMDEFGERIVELTSGGPRAPSKY